ncbi:MAG: PHP domain-containing protein [Thermoleophilia bacterium]|nr:PHP domain-containing protein [Thermoleophilia bacterium]
MVKKAVEYGMPAVAITDHGVLSGAVQFYQEAVKSGINPVIGLEAYVVEDRFRKDYQQEERWHLTLLARNNEGYRNLLRIGSLAFLDGYYFKPRVDYELLREHAAGLICLSGCPHRSPVAGPRAGEFRRGGAGGRAAGRDIRPAKPLHRDPGDRYRRAGSCARAHGRAGRQGRPAFGGYQRRPLPGGG